MCCSRPLIQYNIDISSHTTLSDTCVGKNIGFPSSTLQVRPKSAIYNPKRDDEHPRHFHMGVPPPGKFATDFGKITDNRLLCPLPRTLLVIAGDQFRRDERSDRIPRMIVILSPSLPYIIPLLLFKLREWIMALTRESLSDLSLL